MLGVSEVIAIILILMITIAIAGLAYTFMSSTMASTTSAASSAVDSTTSSMLTSFTIESIDISKVYIRNTGQSVLSNLSVYVNDEPAHFNITPSMIAIGQVGTITIYDFLKENYEIKISTSVFSAARRMPDLCKQAIGCWKFDEGSGTIAYDSSPYGNSGTLTNGPLWTSGNNNAIRFDGTDDYISTNTIILTGDLTLTFLAYRNPNSNTYAMALGHSSLVGKIGFINTNNMLFVRANDTNVGGSTSIPVPVSQWFYVIVMKKSSLVTVYVNGIENILGNQGGTLTLNRIGTDPSWPMNGTIDEVKIFNRAIY